MQNFHNVKLPDFIAIHAVGGPVFATSCITTGSGRESRMLDHDHGLQQYIISDCRLSRVEFEEFNSFFRGRRGQQYSFRMRDYADYEIKNQKITRLDESDIVLEIYKEYPDALNPYRRRITMLDQDSVLVNMPAEVDCDRGLIILPDVLAPSQALCLSANFDIAVRFTSDVLKYHTHIDGSIIIDEIKLIEVI
jgi:uncharacterized protein (TIGR02217 family)